MEKGSWCEATFLAWENQRGECRICGRYIYLNDRSKEGRLIGHHLRNRSEGGPDTVENCEARHQSCETLAHQNWRKGNPPKDFQPGSLR